MGIHLCIRGRVQGVGYRAAFERQARCLGLSGWVRNRRDGSVEAFVAGPRAALEEMVAWARQGPPLAKVDDIDLRETDDGPASPGFSIRATE